MLQRFTFPGAFARHQAFLAAFSGLLLPVTGGELNWKHEELRRFPAKEAFQGVAVDREHFYAIDNRAIGKYRKDTGARVGGWENEAGGPIKHLNSGVVLSEKLYAAHSNFPQVPAQSSMEIWNTVSMKPLHRHIFENAPGSLTWIVPEGDGWIACFAHYRSSSDPALSRVVKFSANWKTLASWSFPAELIERFAGHSSSGGAVGPRGKLFVTGHDARELYVLEIPEGNEQHLKWLATVAISAAGQAFAWDHDESGVLYSIIRQTREVIVSRITPTG